MFPFIPSPLQYTHLVLSQQWKNKILMVKKQWQVKTTHVFVWGSPKRCYLNKVELNVEWCLLSKMLSWRNHTSLWNLSFQCCHHKSVDDQWYDPIPSQALIFGLSVDYILSEHYLLGLKHVFQKRFGMLTCLAMALISTIWLLTTVVSLNA